MANNPQNRTIPEDQITYDFEAIMFLGRAADTLRDEWLRRATHMAASQGRNKVLPEDAVAVRARLLADIVEGRLKLD